MKEVLGFNLLLNYPQNETLYVLKSRSFALWRLTSTLWCSHCVVCVVTAVGFLVNKVFICVVGGLLSRVHVVCVSGFSPGLPQSTVCPPQASSFNGKVESSLVFGSPSVMSFLEGGSLYLEGLYPCTGRLVVCVARCAGTCLSWGWV